jgi:hypothetical protein
MKIYLSLDCGDISFDIKDFDSTFCWETENIPLVGDSLFHVVESKNLSLSGIVTHRPFIIGYETVTLTVQLEQHEANKLKKYWKTNIPERN